MRAYALIAIVAAGCGSSNKVDITKTVGPAGGTVDHSDGTSVAIPAGALSGNANITIASVNATAPEGTVIVGPAYDFGPDGTQFSQPVTITLPFDSAKIPSGRSSSDIVIYTAPRGTTQYAALQTTLAGNTVQTQTSHFTVYLPAVATVSAFDMAMPDCTPQCQTGTSSCSCTETCGGHTITMMCSGTTTFSCFCEIDGQTQSTTPQVSSCSLQSDVQSAFASCAG